MITQLITGILIMSRMLLLHAKDTIGSYLRILDITW